MFYFLLTFFAKELFLLFKITYFPVSPELGNTLQRSWSYTIYAKETHV